MGCQIVILSVSFASTGKSVWQFIFGRPLSSSEDEEAKIGVFAGIPFLGLDALGSAAYGPEAALTILIPLGLMGLTYAVPIFAAIVLILGILYVSYLQTISAYPNGGGSYIVAKENLGKGASLFAGAALVLDYMLDVAVGISAGVEALVSVFPSLHHELLHICLWLLLLVTVINLRGVKSSGMVFAAPTYLFVITLLATIGYGIYLVKSSSGQVTPQVPLPQLVRGDLPGNPWILGWLLLRAFASGCTAMTGVEAVSNGVPNFMAPAQKRAKETLTWIVIILALLLTGILYLCKAYHIGAIDPNARDYQSTISQVVSAVWGRNWIYYLTLFSTISVLALSANTGFADFPRLCRLLAQDNFLPRAFVIRGPRLVFTTGIYVLAAGTAILLIAFGGVTDSLIPLFAVGAFSAFTVSQFGMVVHWKRSKTGHSHFPMMMNLAGGIATAIALVIIVVAKFVEGAWLSVLLIICLVLLFLHIERHYREVGEKIRRREPVDLSDLAEPRVIVPMRNWSQVASIALTYAMRISKDVTCVHVSEDEEISCLLETDWYRIVESPCNEAGLPVPKLVVLPSPFRQLQSPLFQFIREEKLKFPNRPLSIVVPELQEKKWFNQFLHNQRASALKAALLFFGDDGINVINVPWYLDRDQNSGI